jgi:glycosyltransferase involved in cell wall biosynthesis
MAEPVCSIIIRAYNEEKHIGRLLEGIQQQTVQNVEILLVDSGSTDHTISIAQQYPVKVVHIRPDDFTFGRSLNRGIEAASAELCVFASAHVYPVYPDWLERLLAPFENPQVGLSYGKQRGNECSKFSEKCIMEHWYPDQSTGRQAHPFCNNANAAIRRALWLNHPYDESLPGLEDLAWARWAAEQGWWVAYSAEAEIIHVHQETPHGVYNRYRREGMAFKQIYPHEHFRLPDLVRGFTTNTASDLAAARKQGVLREAWRSIFWFRWMQFWGTYRGYRQSGPLTWQLKEAFYYPSGTGESEVEKPPREVPPIQYT